MTLAAIFYGLLDFGVLSRRESGDSGFAKNSQIAEEFSASAMAKISRIEIQNRKGNYQAWTSRIESDWEQDPFIRYNLPKTNKKSQQISSDPGLVFSGYLLVGDKGFAVINGMEYKVGETIEPQGYLVKKITTAKVILQLESEQIVLYLKED